MKIMTLMIILSIVSAAYAEEMPPKPLTNVAGQYLSEGIDLLNANRPAEAIELFEKALTVNYRFSDAYLYRGMANANMGKIDEAIKDYDEAISLDPKRVEAYINRAKAYHQKALADVEKARSMGAKVDDSFLDDLEKKQ